MKRPGQLAPAYNHLRSLGFGVASRRLGRTHHALDDNGRDAREHGLGHGGRQHVPYRVGARRLLLGLGARAEDIPELSRLLNSVVGRQAAR